MAKRTKKKKKGQSATTTKPAAPDNSEIGAFPRVNGDHASITDKTAPSIEQAPIAQQQTEKNMSGLGALPEKEKRADSSGIGGVVGNEDFDEGLSDMEEDSFDMEDDMPPQTKQENPPIVQDNEEEKTEIEPLVEKDKAENNVETKNFARAVEPNEDVNRLNAIAEESKDDIYEESDEQDHDHGAIVEESSDEINDVVCNDNMGAAVVASEENTGNGLRIIAVEDGDKVEEEAMSFPPEEVAPDPPEEISLLSNAPPDVEMAYLPAVLPVAKDTGKDKSKGCAMDIQCCGGRCTCSSPFGTCIFLSLFFLLVVAAVGFGSAVLGSWAASQFFEDDDARDIGTTATTTVAPTPTNVFPVPETSLPTRTVVTPIASPAPTPVPSLRPTAVRTVSPTRPPTIASTGPPSTTDTPTGLPSTTVPETGPPATANPINGLSPSAPVPDTRSPTTSNEFPEFACALSSSGEAVGARKVAEIIHDNAAAVRSDVSLSGDGALLAFALGQASQRIDGTVTVGSVNYEQDLFESLFQYGAGGIYSVALSANGKRVAIGAPNVGDEAFLGIVSVYENVNGSWTRVGEPLLGKGEIVLENGTGYQVDLSSDGDTLAATSRAGVVRVYHYDGSNTWNLVGQPISSPSREYTDSIADMSLDGKVVAIGSVTSNRVDVFRETGGTWNPLGGPIVGSAETVVGFGTAVALSEQGNILAIGQTGSVPQSVLVYQYQGSDWTQIGSTIEQAPERQTQFGQDLSLSASGCRVLIGAPVIAFDDGIGAFSYMEAFDFNGTEWQSSTGQLFHEEGVFADTAAVSLSPDGLHAAMSSTKSTIVYNVNVA